MNLFLKSFAAIMLVVLCCACDSMDSYSARGMTRMNLNNKWNCKFKSVNGTLNGKFTAKQDNPILVVENRLESGAATIIVKSDGKEIVPEHPMASGTETLRNLPLHKGDKVIVKVSLTDAKGGFSVTMP